MKKILILTVTAGNAHNACARAMQTKLEELGAIVKTVDLLKSYSSARYCWAYDRGYAIAMSRLPKLYGKFYEKYLNAGSDGRFTCAAQGAALSVVRGLFAEIAGFQPDVIYCTHFLAAIALSDLRLVYRLPCKCVAAVLDYVKSPFWESGTGIDYLTLPNEDFIDEFLFAGFERRQLIPLGIPVGNDGRTATDKREARKNLGLDGNAFTILVTFGGGLWRGGYKIFADALDAISGQNAQIIMINGRDKRSYKKVAKTVNRSGARVLNVGFTDNFPLYIAAADVAVCKCGGASSTEIINADVPLIVTEKLSAQEKYNLEYLKKAGVAFSFKDRTELKEIISEFADGAKKHKSAKIVRREAARDLASFIMSLPQADYGAFAVTSTELKNAKRNVKRALKLADIYGEKFLDAYPLYSGKLFK